MAGQVGYSIIQIFVEHLLYVNQLIAAVGKKLLKNGSAVKGLRINKSESHDLYEASLRVHVITTLSNTFWEAKK